jgi:DGQHR domain-containing protein
MRSPGYLAQNRVSVRFTIPRNAFTYGKRYTDPTFPRQGNRETPTPAVYMADKNDSKKPLLSPLLTAKPARQREFTRRKDAFVVQGVHPADVTKYEADGWTVQREGSRKVTPSRIKEIGGFIKKGGFFPTNLLINFTEKCRFDPLSNKENADPNTKFGWLYLPRKYKSAWVIDGQHRLYGYSNIDEKHWDQNIAVIAFEEMDTKDEADLFVTINHKQKSVPKSVIVSLQSDLKWGSDDPQERLSALCSRLVKTLNSDPTSPFFQRFAVQGVVAKENQSLTMPEVVNGLNKSGLLGKTIHKGILSPGPLSGATDDDTNDRARRVLNGYFGKLREANTTRWEAARSAYVSTNPGIRAQVLLVADVIKYLQVKEDIEPQLLDEDTLLKHVLRVVRPVFEFISDADNADIYDKFSRKFGEGGVREYADNLAELVLEKFRDFGSEDFKTRLLKAIRAQVARFTNDAEVLCDPFCGSAVVAWDLAEQFEKPVIAGDLQSFATARAAAILMRTEPVADLARSIGGSEDEHDAFAEANDQEELAERLRRTGTGAPYIRILPNPYDSRYQNNYQFRNDAGFRIAYTPQITPEDL